MAAVQYFSNTGWLVKVVSHQVVSEEVLAGTVIPGGGGRGRLYITVHRHHQNDFCIKMGSDYMHPLYCFRNYEGQFKSQKQCP